MTLGRGKSLTTLVTALPPLTADPCVLACRPVRFLRVPAPVVAGS